MAVLAVGVHTTKGLGMFHLGFFLGTGFGIQAWKANGDHGPWVGHNVSEWMRPDLYVDMARSLERAGFDYILIEDTSMVEDTFGGTAEATLRHGRFAPKNDPMPLVPLIAQDTKHIGIIPTVSTIQYPPYLAARLFATLDHLTHGRVGMNVVTSVTDRVAQNFGYDKHLDHADRYTMAGEWIEVVRKLQASWEPDAVIADPVNGVYADHTKVHPIDHVGAYFSVRGPLNTIPGPQYQTPIASAGSSEQGRTLAASYGDTMVSLAPTVEEMKKYREDMSARMIAQGRKPSDIKLLFLSSPVVAATDADAQAIVEAGRAARDSPAAIEQNLWMMSYVSGGRVDFSRYPLDTPVEEIDLTDVNGEKSSVAAIFKDSAGKTLRQIATGNLHGSGVDLVGSPETVASKMEEVMEEVGGDGFLVALPTVTRTSIAALADGLAPVLQRRGLIRSEYTGATLRENLQAF
ncbi:NtaA/DmoA family FMN-dependent monooxygenase [Microbacterium sp. E-13]|uniref:NtaA/DmoA family FMN-dependent monooxygenase n=1 Tax=Microbacterium sp. E-13 TaxID=3404048 RepID=UPI003CF17940